MDITNNLENLESFFENYTFIEKYLINRKNSEIDINIQIKEPFAKNQINQEIIFTDNSIGHLVFSKKNILIQLISLIFLII